MLIDLTAWHLMQSSWATKPALGLQSQEVISKNSRRKRAVGAGKKNSVPVVKNHLFWFIHPSDIYEGNDSKSAVSWQQKSSLQKTEQIAN